MKLLILEDNIDFAANLKMSVDDSLLFDEVHHCAKLSDAIHMSSSLKYDMFLVDLQLPDGSGYEFISYVRSNGENSDTPVIIMTGMDEEVSDILNSFNTQQCQRYIKKTFNTDTLISMMKDVLLKPIGEKVPVQKISLRYKGNNFIFKYDDIMFLETKEKNLWCFLNKKEVNVGRIPLNTILQELDRKEFLQIHRSIIINTTYVVEYSTTSTSSYVKLKGYDTRLPIGIRFREVVRTFFDD